MTEQELESTMTEFAKSLDSKGYAICMAVVQKNPSDEDKTQVAAFAHMDGIKGDKVVTMLRTLDTCKESILDSMLSKDGKNIVKEVLDRIFSENKPTDGVKQ